MNTTIDQFILGLADKNAQSAEALEGKLHTASEHLRLTIVGACGGLFVILGAVILARIGDLTDKQTMLTAVVALAGLVLTATSLLSGVSAVAATHARHKVREHFLDLKRRQAEMDATEEAAKGEESLVLMEVTSQVLEDVLRTAAIQGLARPQLEEILALTKLYGAHSLGAASTLESSRLLASSATRVFQRYEAGHGRLMARASYMRLCKKLTAEEASS